jgi:pimeloyl-ACP methyl ester carboxylesterase
MSSLHVDDSGSGEPVILLHSHGLSGRQWRRLAGDLVARGMRALAIDLSGQGKSEPWPEPDTFRFDLDVMRVAEILRTLGRAHVVGHSYGGLIALHVALAEPSALLSLTVFDPVAFSVLDSEADRDARAVLDSLDFSWGSSPEDRDRWLQMFVDFWSGPGAWRSLRDDARGEFRRVAWVIREGVRTLREDRTAAPAFRALACATLLLTGEQSPLPARRVVDRLAETIPNARRIVIAGVGHLGPVANAAAVNPHILEHLVAHGTGPICQGGGVMCS